jgi:hypothetical protein
VTDKEPHDVADAISKFTLAHLQCRRYGHSWRPWRAEVFTRGRGYMEAVRCDRCATERTEECDRYGGVVSAHYVYPDGYLVKGLGRLTGEDRGQLRIAAIRRRVRRG